MESDKAYKSFTDLRNYKGAIYELVKTFPSSEKYRLVDQMVRPSRSIGSNISEGYGRYTYKDQIHFCIQARGSLNETLNHLIDAYDCKYISVETLKEFQSKTIHLEMLLNGYIAWLKKMLN